MGLVSKLKNILFEEEEVEIPVIEKKEKKPEVEEKNIPKESLEEKPKINVDADSIVMNDNVITDDEFFDDFFHDDE